jgi:hypothetical protein
MEPEGSLPHSQVLSTFLFPEPAQSSPYPLPTSRNSILILSSHLSLGPRSDLFPSVFTTKTIHASHRPHPSYMLSPFHHLQTLWHSVQYIVQRTPPNNGHNRWPKHVTCCAIYNTINLHICVCNCWACLL